LNAFPLEVWLSGTHHDLNAAVAALDSCGRLGWTSPRIPLAGADRGRVRLALHLHVALPAAGTTAASEGGVLLIGEHAA